VTASTRPLYVAADIHGNRAEFQDLLADAALINRAGDWTGGDARLWLLGDYVDRGDDGIGVIDDVRRLSLAAAAAGGEVGALLGNHEAQLLAAWRFGTTPVPGWDEPGGFGGGWARFGGRQEDMARLTREHVAWMAGLAAVAVVDDYLFVHSDTDRYLEFGGDVEAVNSAVAAALVCPDVVEWVEFTDRICDRGVFRDPALAAEAVAKMLAALGGTVLVHGHSAVTKYFDVPPGEVTGPVRYADDRVIAIDGGAHEGGRVLLTRLA